MTKNMKFSLLILLAFMVVSACGTSQVAPPPDEISVRLKWLHGVQFAGFYIAEQKGFFEEENLSVTLLEGGLDFDEIDLVATGQDDFGIVAGPQILVARSVDVPVKAVATIFRIDPSVYFALTESGIERPQDFIGKRVIVNPADAKLPVMLKNVGIDMDQINAVPPSSDLETFYSGEVEVWSGYITNQVVRARLDGYEINVIFPGDYGVHTYGDCIITTDEMIQEKPELIKRFLRAVLRGWRYAIENPEEATAATARYSETNDDAFLLASMEAQIPLIHTGEAPIGWMEGEAWQSMYSFLIAHKNLADVVAVEDVYSMWFLEDLFGGE